MARPIKSRNRKSLKYCHDKTSDQAYIRINGRKIYHGKFGSVESTETYHRALIEQPANSDRTSDLNDTTITTLAIAYVKHAATYYVTNGKTTQMVDVKQVMKHLRRSYASVNPNEFGPLRFQAFRQITVHQPGIGQDDHQRLLCIALPFR